MQKYIDKNKVIILICMLLSIFTGMSLDIYVPSLSKIMTEFSANQADVQLTLGIFLLSFSIAQPIFGFLSDSFGRKISLIIGLIVYFIASLACFVATSIELLLIARFIQGIGACAAIVSAFAIVKDNYEENDCTRIFSYLSMAMTIVPSIAPIIGGIINDHIGWRFNFIVLAGLGIVTEVLVIIFLPHHKQIHYSKITVKDAIGNYLMLFMHPQYMSYVLCSVAAFIPLFCIISSYSFIMIPSLHISTTMFGIILTLHAISMAFGSYIPSKFANNYKVDVFIQMGTLFSLLSGVMMLIFYFIFGITILGLIIPMMIFSFSSGLITPTSISAAIEPFQDCSGKAIALAGFIRFISAMIISNLLTRYFKNSISILSLIIIICGFINLLAPYLLYASKHQNKMA